MAPWRRVHSVECLIVLRCLPRVGMLLVGFNGMGWEVYLITPVVGSKSQALQVWSGPHSGTGQCPIARRGRCDLAGCGLRPMRNLWPRMGVSWETDSASSFFLHCWVGTDGWGFGGIRVAGATLGVLPCRTRAPSGPWEGSHPSCSVQFVFFLSFSPFLPPRRSIL